MQPAARSISPRPGRGDVVAVARVAWMLRLKISLLALAAATAATGSAAPCKAIQTTALPLSLHASSCGVVSASECF
jgi:hypothetical protein